MLLRCALLLALLSCVRTTKDFHRDGLFNSDINRRFSFWPSVHNGATLLRIRRASQPSQNLEVEQSAVAADVQGPSEGVGDVKQPPSPAVQPQSPAVQPQSHAVQPQSPAVQPQTAVQSNLKNSTSNEDSPPAANVQALNISSGLSNKTPKGITSEDTPIPTVPPTIVTIKDNGTSAEKATKQWDFSNPEATKRGLIVFGGFALLAMAYFIFYRTKSKFNETNNSNGPSESSQFRYGVLESDDRRDNLELSRVPLTMESDEEEDEDLEIFDLEQKKKSLSYVNLQANDEDIVLSPRDKEERDDLLLDIEDGNSDILINWSHNSSKSIL